MIRTTCTKIRTFCVSLILLGLTTTAQADWEALALDNPADFDFASFSGCTGFSKDPTALCSLYYEDGMLKLSLWPGVIAAGDVISIGAGIRSLLFGPNDVRGVSVKVGIDPASGCFNYDDRLIYGGNGGFRAWIGTQVIDSVPVVTQAAVDRVFFSPHIGGGLRDIRGLKDSAILRSVSTLGTFGEYATPSFDNTARDAAEPVMNSLDWHKPKKVEFISSSNGNFSYTLNFDPKLKDVDPAVVGPASDTGPSIFGSFSIENTGAVPLAHPGCTMEFGAAELFVR